MKGIIEIIKTLDVGDGANIEEVITAIENAGVDHQQAETSISKLKEKGYIFEPSHGKIKTI